MLFFDEFETCIFCARALWGTPSGPVDRGRPSWASREVQRPPPIDPEAGAASSDFPGGREGAVFVC